MKPTPSFPHCIGSRVARQTARLAQIATADTIHGGARALILAKRADTLGAQFADGVTAREIVLHIYSRSTGRTCERFGAWECPECGCVSLGLELAFACCAPSEGGEW